MQFIREILQCDPTDSPAALCAQLVPCAWAIEAASHPPAGHDPAQLPLGEGLIGGLAVSVTTATAMRLPLGPGLVDRVAALGSVPGPLAGLALHELIVNATIHGNLRVGSGDLGHWHDIAQRQTLISRSLADPVLATRVVTVALGWRVDQVIAIVADEGDGYDVKAPQLPSRGAGRGLRLARTIGRVEVFRGGRQTAITMQAAPHADGDRR